MINAYYVIRQLMDDEDSWDDELIYHYLYGKSTVYGWTIRIDDARKFKSIKEIRTFITKSLKSDYIENDHGNWEFQGVFDVVRSDVITPVHTMGLLRSVA
jgi:hypothetical protein